MLPRNLQAVAARSALRSGRRVASTARARPARSAAVAAPSSSGFHSSSRAAFHSSSSRRDEVPKSPFQTFVDVLKDELRKNRELQDNVKQLQGDVDKFQDSEAMKRARDAYERARVRCVVINGLVWDADWTSIVDDQYQGEPSITGCCRCAQEDWCQRR